MGAYACITPPPRHAVSQTPHHHNHQHQPGLRALAAALRTGRLSQLRRLELSGNNLVGGEPLPDGADPAQWQALLPFLEEGGRDERAMQAFAGALEVGRDVEGSGWMCMVFT